VSSIAATEAAHGPTAGLVNADRNFGRMHPVEKLRMDQLGRRDQDRSAWTLPARSARFKQD
jgi:hypothetical protein